MKKTAVIAITVLSVTGAAALWSCPAWVPRFCNELFQLRVSPTMRVTRLKLMEPLLRRAIDIECAKNGCFTSRSVEIRMAYVNMVSRQAADIAWGPGRKINGRNSMTVDAKEMFRRCEIMCRQLKAVIEAIEAADTGEDDLQYIPFEADVCLAFVMIDSGKISEPIDILKDIYQKNPDLWAAAQPYADLLRLNGKEDKADKIENRFQGNYPGYTNSMWCRVYYERWKKMDFL